MNQKKISSALAIFTFSFICLFVLGSPLFIEASTRTIHYQGRLKHSSAGLFNGTIDIGVAFLYNETTTPEACFDNVSVNQGIFGIDIDTSNFVSGWFFNFYEADNDVYNMRINIYENSGTCSGTILDSFTEDINASPMAITSKFLDGRSGLDNIIGDARITGDTWVYNNLNVFGEAAISEAVTLSHTLDVLDNASFWKNLDVFQNANIQNNLNVLQNASISGATDVGSLAVGGGANIFGDLSVSGITSLEDNLSVSGHASISGVLNSGGLNVGNEVSTANAYISGSTFIDYGLSVGSTLSVTGSSSIGSNLNVIGNLGVGFSGVPSDRIQVDGYTRLGRVLNDGVGSTAGRLIFSGGADYATYNSDNSDPLWMERYNTASDQTVLRINIGDVDDANDLFQIGRTSGGIWTETHIFAANGDARHVGDLRIEGGNVRISPEDTTNEGGQIDFNGADEYDGFHIDNYQSQARISWTGENDHTLMAFTTGDYVTNMSIDGSYSCGGSDLAEKMKGEENLQAGDVVVISKNNPETIIKSTKAYDYSVIGIVSTDPGMVLGENALNEDVEKLEIDGLPIALAGRVPACVVDENGPVHMGDLLVTSSTAGCLMKGDPGKIGAGMLVAKAMDNMEGNKDSIVVFVK